MTELSEITDLEQAYFELEKIKTQVNALSDFLSSKLRDQYAAKPKTKGMIDPRSGRHFREQSREDNGS